MDVDHAGIGVLALFIRKGAGIGKQSLRIEREHKIAHVHSLPFSQDLDTLCFDLRIIAYVGVDLVVGDDGHHGSAHAHGRSLGDGNTASPCRQFGLVGSADGHTAAGFKLRESGLAALTDIDLGFSVCHQHGDGACDGHVTVRPAHGACQRLGRQLADVGFIRILGQI